MIVPYCYHKMGLRMFEENRWQDIPMCVGRNCHESCLLEYPSDEPQVRKDNQDLLNIILTITLED